MATITLKNGETLNLTMNEVAEILKLQGMATTPIFDPCVKSNELNKRKRDEVASAENREPIPYAKFGKRAKGIADNARKHCKNAGFVIQYPKNGNKGNGWIWMDTDGVFVEGLSPNWKWSKRRKMHYYDLNPKPAKKANKH